MERGKGEGKRGGKKEDVEIREMGGRRQTQGQQADRVVEGGGKTDRWDSKRRVWKSSEEDDR